MNNLHKATKLYIFFIISITSILFIRCDKNQSNIPNVLVNFTIRLDDPEYFDLAGIGNHVFIAQGAHLNTHDGGTWVFRKEIPNLRIFGPIVIGDNCVIGENAIIQPIIVLISRRIAFIEIIHDSDNCLSFD